MISPVKTFTEIVNRHSIFLSSIALPFALGYVLSRAIVNKNYYVMLVVAIAFVGFLVLKSNIISISVILFLAFFGNWFQALGILPGQFIWLVEVIIVALFLKAVFLKILAGEKIQLKYICTVLLFLSIVLISLVLNSTSFIYVSLFLRLLIRYYLLYLALINLELSEKSIKLLTKLLVFLFIIQIPTAIVKYFHYGQGEQAIGTYEFSAGALSTVLPLIALSFCFAFYFFYKRSRLYLLLALSFIIFGVIGGKKAIIIVVPVLVLFLGFFIRGQSKNVLRYFLWGSLIVIFAAFISVRFIGRLNPQEHGEKSVFKYLSGYFMAYETNVYEGQSVGRIATTKNVFHILEDSGFEKLLFGLGPGSYIKTRFGGLKENVMASLPIMYGITGFTWLALQVGYVGAFFYLGLFYIMLIGFLHFYKREEKPYWKSVGFGMFGFSFVMLFINIFYAPIIFDDLVPLVFFLLSAFLERMKAKRSLLGIEAI